MKKPIIYLTILFLSIGIIGFSFFKTPIQNLFNDETEGEWKPASEVINVSEEINSLDEFYEITNTSRIELVDDGMSVEDDFRVNDGILEIKIMEMGGVN